MKQKIGLFIICLICLSSAQAEDIFENQEQYGALQEIQHADTQKEFDAGMQQYTASLENGEGENINDPLMASTEAMEKSHEVRSERGTDILEDGDESSFDIHE